MHVDHELVEFVPVDEQEYDEVIEDYEEEILVQGEPQSRLVLTLLTRRLPKASLGAWPLFLMIIEYIWCAFTL